MAQLTYRDLAPGMDAAVAVLAIALGVWMLAAPVVGTTMATGAYDKLRAIPEMVWGAGFLATGSQALYSRLQNGSGTYRMAVWRVVSMAFLAVSFLAWFAGFASVSVFGVTSSTALPIYGVASVMAFLGVRGAAEDAGARHDRPT